MKNGPSNQPSSRVSSFALFSQKVEFKTWSLRIEKSFIFEWYLLFFQDSMSFPEFCLETILLVQALQLHKCEWPRVLLMVKEYFLSNSINEVHVQSKK